MNYYKRHLGDYAKKAGRLSMLQHGSYTLLIDACYDREQFPTRDEAIEWTWASSTAEVEAVEFVLRKFFTLEDGLYVQKRIQEEITEYHEKAETNKRIALERETKRRENNTNRAQGVNEAPPNHEPITTNQEPVTKGRAPRKRNAPPPAIDRPDDVAEQVWADWVQLRTKKRAGVSLTAISGARSEAAKAGVTLERFLAIWCARGSQGLDADWIKPNERAGPSASAAQALESFRERDARAAAERVAAFAPDIAARIPSKTNFSQEIEDVTAIDRY